VNNLIKVLGVDPGYGRCGWGIVCSEGSRLTTLAYDVIDIPAKRSFPGRLVQLHEQLRRVIDTYRPDEAAIEQLFFSKNVKTAINVGQARGVVVLTCSQKNIPVAGYKPGEVKMAVSGYGAAGKSQIQHMVKILLALPDVPKPDDAADALAVAICHVHSRTRQNLVQRKQTGKAKP
jgi:crossover junction endodeoxyribonuclease RuvC